MITMALCFTGGALIAAAMILITGARVRFCLSAEFSAVRLKMWICPPRGPSLMRVEYLLLWQDMTAYRNGKRLKPGRRKKLKRARIDAGDLLKAVRQGVEVEELRLYGGPGIRRDACLSVLLTGVLREAFRLAFFALKAKNSSVGLLPAFDRDELCLNLEGILRVRPAQIIRAAIRAARAASGPKSAFAAK